MTRQRVQSRPSQQCSSGGDVTPSEKPSAKLGSAVFAQLLLPLQRFFRTEAAAGIVLALATVAALVWVNGFDEASYRRLVDSPLVVGLGSQLLRIDVTLAGAINDALMTVFFFVVGLEIKHELTHGHLQTVRKALLPLCAAAGGMIVPALIYWMLNRSGPAASGWAIPMATDIAFAAGVLTLLRKRVASSVPVFLVALAIFDDIGGVLIIAAFYGNGIHGWALLLAAVASLVATGVLRRSHHGVLIAAVGVILWVLFHDAGIHATLAGVALGLMIPATPERAARDVLGELNAHTGALLAKPPDEAIENAEVQAIESVLVRMEAPVLRLMRLLHPAVAFGIVPAFAFANAGVRFVDLPIGALLAPVTLGVFLGLVIGKLIGVFVATMIAVKLGVSPLPEGTDRITLVGVSALAGIGFTVALFIANLAFASDPALLAQAKVGILAGSVVATALGAGVIATRRARPAAAATVAQEPQTTEPPTHRQQVQHERYSGSGVP